MANYLVAVKCSICGSRHRTSRHNRQGAFGVKALKHRHGGSG